jgi:thiamine pyrophosphate-dependent acetolactate synthase large subunit-like protein
MDVFEELFYWGDVILSSTQKLIHVDPIPGRIGRTEPTDVGVISNCKTALKDITNLVKNHIDEKNMAIDIDEISFRKHHSKLDAQHRHQTFENSVKENWDMNPMSPARMMYELSNAVPENAMILDDSVSNREAVRHYFAAGKRGDIVGIRGQSIGGGIGATMGLQCANPGNPVFGIIGDGSAMMTIQGLWTAANDNIPCVFVICNNGMYRILRVNYNIYQSEILKETEPAGENLLHSEFSTPFNIATIAQGMGLHGERITDPNQIAPAVTRVLKTGGPGVLDIVIDGSL